MAVLVGDTVRVPLVAFVPVQPPEAVHEVALVEDQVSVAFCPDTIVDGAADKVTVGTVGALTTVTVLLPEAEPPAPVHVIV